MVADVYWDNAIGLAACIGPRLHGISSQPVRQLISTWELTFGRLLRCIGI